LTASTATPKIEPVKGKKEVSFMKKVIGVVLVCCLLAALPFTVTACKDEADGGGNGGNGAPTGGQLPDYEIGYTWTWSYVMYETTTTLTEEVIGEETVEGRDCYILNMALDPSISFTQAGGETVITGMKYWADKATGLYEVKMEVSGTYEGEAFTQTIISDYDPWESPFPLEIGKEVTAEKTVTSYFGDTQVGQPVVGTEKYVVEGKESITVSAGTFDCWKLAIYDDSDNQTYTAWWSDEVKSVIKNVDSAGNTVMELLSYSVS
jgi:hypothetical protein